MKWDADRYDRSFRLVTDAGSSLVDVLAPRSGEVILDLGCGTGELTAAIAARGAHVFGVDGSMDMIARARHRHPELDFSVSDAAALEVDKPLDAVFSNAALHWMTHQDDVLRRVCACLRPGGRLVAEMGGAGNVTALLAAIDAARAARGFGPAERPWYFPTPAEQAVRLERAGLWPRLLQWFERPTRIGADETAIIEWVAVFGTPLLADLPEALRSVVVTEVAEIARPELCRDDGWYADYVRLRIVAEKIAVDPLDDPAEDA